MPAEYQLPEDLFDVNIASSKNSTINLCDGLRRKATILHDLKSGTRKPFYMQSCASLSKSTDHKFTKDVGKAMFSRFTSLKTIEKPKYIEVIVNKNVSMEKAKYSEPIFRPL